MASHLWRTKATGSAGGNLLSNSDFNIRLKRFCDRHNYEKDSAITELQNDDLFRIKAGYSIIKDDCDYIIDNSKTTDNFQNKIEEIMKIIGETRV